MSAAPSPRERPIVMTGESVRAILAGRKTQTRRILSDELQVAFDRAGEAILRGWPRQRGIGWDEVKTLWVREAHQINAFGSHPNWTAEHVIYAADDACVEMQPPVPFVGTCDIGLRRWRSPIHMPRWASRLTLAVTDVRVQRLQDISEDDADADGLECLSRDGDRLWRTGVADLVALGLPWSKWNADPRHAYRDLWNAIHGRTAWDKNPWVAAITFTPTGAPA